MLLAKCPKFVTSELMDALKTGLDRPCTRLVTTPRISRGGHPVDPASPSPICVRTEAYSLPIAIL